jgi:hypothetical protein
MELFIPSFPFSDWRKHFLQTKKCTLINKNKIMPLCIDDYIKYNNDSNCIFINNIENIEMLDNKSTC